MAWNYSGDPSSSKKDELRFNIGDTDSQDQLMSDGEINYLLTKSNQSIALSCISACDLLAMKFARLADESVGQVRISYSQKYAQYLKMKEAFRSKAAIDECMPYAGGISQSDKETMRDNGDLVQPIFSRHQHEAKAVSIELEPPLDNDHIT